MKQTWLRAVCAALLCAVLSPAGAQPAGWSRCDLGDIRIDAEFPAARADACFRQSDDAVAVLVMPEAADVNPSPWYAFRAVADTPRRVELTLVYGQSKHRYLPKVSDDGQSWELLPAERVRVADDGKTATLELDLGPQPLWVAAQEPWPSARHRAFLDHWRGRDDIALSRLGKSLRGKPIGMLQTDPGRDRPQTLVVVGRQHPPEISGARALESFVETLLDDSELSRRFRATHRVVVVPMLNPDGVDRGYWRHSAGGKDMNRDWGPFVLPETRLMRDLLASIDADPGTRLTAFVDFHSTREDVFYTQRDADPMQPPGFYARWLGRLQERMPDYHVNRKPGHQSGMPTAKTWVYETYGVPAVTFEIGDETPPALTARLASEAARALMETLLPAAAAAEPAQADVLAAGDGRFVFDGWSGPALPVWYYRPKAVRANTPVVFVMHGVNRDADRYRDQWSALAREHDFILVVPEFGEKDFPGATGYNQGYVVDRNGKPRPRSQWSFRALEPLFDAVRARTGTQVDRYELYGHSAGAQFVHRYVLFMPEARLGQAVSANAGWYTLPSLDVDYPYGLRHSGLSAADLQRALTQPLTVLLGTADNDPGHPNLRRTPEALAQGPHRLARGEHFVEQARQAAAGSGVDLAWQLRYVEGVSHDNGAMAPAAAKLLGRRGAARED